MFMAGFDICFAIVITVHAATAERGVKSANKYIIDKGKKSLLTTCVYWFEIGQPCLCPFPAPLAQGNSLSQNPDLS